MKGERSNTKFGNRCSKCHFCRRCVRGVTSCRLLLLANTTRIWKHTFVASSSFIVRLVLSSHARPQMWMKTSKRKSKNCKHVHTVISTVRARKLACGFASRRETTQRHALYSPKCACAIKPSTTLKWVVSSEDSAPRWPRSFAASAVCSYSIQI